MNDRNKVIMHCNMDKIVLDCFTIAYKRPPTTNEYLFSSK